MAKVDENEKVVKETVANPDANPPEKDMMHEGSPPPEEIAEPQAEGGNAAAAEGVKIEVIEEDRPGGDESEAADPVAVLQAELAAAQAKADEYLDKMQRTAAEYQNSRRRQEKQMAEELERANSRLIRSLLPILDDFELAFGNVPESLQADGANGDTGNSAGAEQAWVSGFRQIHKKLLDTLMEQGLEVMATTGPFDPARHEAISSEPSESVESGHIIETLRAGYLYKGQVLRPALIRVAA